MSHRYDILLLFTTISGFFVALNITAEKYQMHEFSLSLVRIDMVSCGLSVHSKTPLRKHLLTIIEGQISLKFRVLYELISEFHLICSSW